SLELSEAIDSMYWWHQNAQVCYVYLHDTDKLPWPTEPYDPYVAKMFRVMPIMTNCNKHHETPLLLNNDHHNVLAMQPRYD
ncbi:hypothetical protein BKA82DRAFT_3981327, partial [Pisolithus tinctorius]